MSERFICFPNSLVYGPCTYLYIRVSEGDQLISEIVFRKSGCLLSKKGLFMLRESCILLYDLMGMGINCSRIYLKVARNGAGIDAYWISIKVYKT